MALNQRTETTGAFDALGFTFEPLGVVRLNVWHCLQDSEGKLSYSGVEEIAVLTNADRVSPTTLLKVDAGDPAGVAVVDFLYAQLPQLKVMVETFATVNNLV